MATGWDTPPTADEAQAAGWDTPPTPEEMESPPDNFAAESEAMSPGQRALAALGGGAITGLQRLRGLFPPGQVPWPYPSAGTPEEVKAARGPLERSTGGRLAGFAGEALPALLLGQGVVSAAGKASSIGPQVLGGAAEGLMMSDEGNRASSIAAGGGGALGGALLAKGIGAAGNRVAKAWHGEAPRLSAVAEAPRPGVTVEAATPGISVALPGSGGSFVMDEAERSLASAIARGEIDKPVAYLLSNGVDLAPWQKAKPSSALARVGKAMSSVAEGEEIAKVADRANAQTRALVLGKGIPPGMEAFPKGHVANVSADLGKLREGFNEAYTKIDFLPVYPTVMRGEGQSVTLREAFGEAIDAVDFADPAVASRVKGQLDRKLSQIGVNPDKAQAVSRIKAEGLLKIRSDLRTRAGKLAGSTDQAAVDEREMLHAAEDAITEALDSQIPPESAQYLRDVDRRYASFAAARDAQAMARKRSPTEDFTPSDLMRAVTSRRTKTALAEGDYGDLAPEIEAFARIWNDAPRTGERVATLSSLKGAAGAVTVQPAMTKVAMSPTVERLILRETRPQRLTRSAAELRRRLEPYVGLSGRVGGAVGASTALGPDRD